MGSPRNANAVIFRGESVDQGVVLYKGCARSRTSLRSSAFVLLNVVEAKGEDLDDYLNEDLFPIIVLLYRTRFLFLHACVVL